MSKEGEKGIAPVDNGDAWHGAPAHLFPRAEDLIPVADALARSVGAVHAVLSLNPALFAAGTVGTEGIPESIRLAVHQLGAPLDTPEKGLIVEDFQASEAHASVADELVKLGVAMLVRFPLRGPGGVIGLAELHYSRSLEITDIDRTRLQLQTEHAAMNVVNVRLFNLIERAKKEWESTFDAIRDGISIHDRDCQIKRANWGLGMMLGTNGSSTAWGRFHPATCSAPWRNESSQGRRSASKLSVILSTSPK